MYRREVGGRALTFGVSGLLRKNALIMYDRETKSLWSHYEGTALSGEFKGRSLAIVGAESKVLFGDFKRRFPAVKVLVVEGASDRPGSYPGYATNDNKLGVGPVRNRDTRLPGKEPILGIRIGDEATAVRLATLVQRRVVPIQLGDHRIVAFGEPDLGLFGAFELPEGIEITRIEGRQLFTADGRSWKVGDGSGDPPLGVVPALRTFWFAWADHYPNTELVDQPAQKATVNDDLGPGNEPRRR